MHEYELLIKAANLRRIDEEYNIHLLAFKTFQVKAMKKSGKKRKPVYDRFSKFYDYKRRINEVLKVETKDNTRMARLRDFLILKRKKGGEDNV